MGEYIICVCVCVRGRGWRGHVPHVYGRVNSQGNQLNDKLTVNRWWTLHRGDYIGGVQCVML